MSHTEIPIVPFPADRVPNAPWEADSRPCPSCRDDAVVDVGSDPKTGMEQRAPCPTCQRGFMCEFGYGRATVTVGNRTKTFFYRSSKPPWGPGGYWARNAAMLAMVHNDVVSEPLPDEENARRMTILEQALAAGGFTPEMLADLYRDDPVGRAAHDAETLRRDQEAHHRLVLPPDPKSGELAEILREAADGPCADCRESHPLVTFGSVRVCRGCAAARDLAAVKVEF